MIRAGIVGGTGYTGVELLRLLLPHPEVEVQVITSRAEEGERVDTHFPNLRGVCDLCYTAPDPETLAKLDVVFFATPHGVAMDSAPELLARDVRVIDLGADFRLADAEAFAHWYGMAHRAPEALRAACYGLPEYFREQIAQSRLIANPGCYPTAVILGFAPLLEAGLLHQDTLIADCKSGVSGAGRTGRVNLIVPEAADSVTAYGVSGHRHRPEIEATLSKLSGETIELQFTPHLMPMIRGIHATLYGRLRQPLSDAALQTLFAERYAQEPFVDVLPFGSHPATRSVRGANVCRIAVHQPRPGQVVVLSVIDNLVKGAAGQAVQNMNRLFALPETLGLTQIALLP
ncbi:MULTISPECIES: N-acetyl-gamma-glutamyl-phosphate reductase [Acidithiobacillus]|uniref:N-acetyl-gamma-glutamyl-phosphate reductase n=3 Tax=Acidithiobacillus thiooxidans TaxID=930 RepID=A0A1C2J776_ACITH|nr:MULTISPECIES: N-acetyl-gamma-glutamyl-phosphate reductase [Acidithiobacillus]MBU2740598.1 N-acetyl-gamma-glutamyl-phosphate reductase [Acidithiobacillus albertensis]MBU2842568.1 N-acetyl-gamma-glutamyl-phosphate reductase [Acidithiobacillus thiooxidans]MDA8175622.1 N-acetyl-gamma-glutamyl-phosphate reductase [Acidithiobacillus sp.]OCX68987.1 N-acetyl-gamma-glutamyl-phosphate reductase [Acidithiobacillus thiooxidans]OCX69101.1 N-acetyl-gamma-glutamyl-phosphate reductase [Acidithiobacillus th